MLGNPSILDCKVKMNSRKKLWWVTFGCQNWFLGKRNWFKHAISQVLLAVYICDVRFLYQEQSSAEARRGAIVW